MAISLSAFPRRLQNEHGEVSYDWAPGYYKGQCADNEYVAGVAYTWQWNQGGVPDALLCRPLA